MLGTQLELHLHGYNHYDVRIDERFDYQASSRVFARVFRVFSKEAAKYQVAEINANWSYRKC